MADYGHKETDKRLAAIEKRVETIYKQASEEMQEKLAKWYKDFKRLDEQKASLVKAGKLAQADYLAWRKGKMAESGRLKDLVDTLTADYVNSDKIAMQIVRGDMPDVYALNANYAAYSIERDMGVNLSWSLYDHSTVERLIREDPDVLPLPSVNVSLDERWNKQHLNNAITQGILQGESIPHIADRLQRILGMDRTAAIRSARTATTAAECSGRIDAYKYAESLGIQLKQMWRATLDGKTRHAHRILDGQMVDIGQPFEVGGVEIRYPGDPSAPGYLVYNCRCTIVSVDKFHDPNAPRASKLGDISYEDWKAGKEFDSANKWGIISGNVQKSVDNTLKNGIMVSDKADSVSARNSAVGKPKLVSAGAPLSKRQTALLNNLQNDGDFVTVRKRGCSLKDIAALSAHEGVEFALLTRKGERMVFRGNDHHVNALNGVTVPQYRDAGWKWSGHTHVHGDLLPSDGDQKILALFNQQKSAIYYYDGRYSIFSRK